MKAIVADTAGTGQVWDTDGDAHDLDPDSWYETDVRDTIVTGDGQQAWVRYRDDGRTVEVPPNTSYQIEYQSDDVVDNRRYSAADVLIEAMAGIGTDENAVYEVLESASARSGGIDDLSAAFEERTGRSLQDALADEMSGDELERALSYLR